MPDCCFYKDLCSSQAELWEHRGRLAEGEVTWEFLRESCLLAFDCCVVAAFLVDLEYIGSVRMVEWADVEQVRILGSWWWQEILED